ncbi:MAG: protein TonB [Flavobacteriales bacterium]|jgi:protein TonB
MNISRFILSLIPAVVVTFGLLTLMHLLIANDLKEPEQGENYTIPDITMPDRDVTQEFDTRKPDKPDEADEPPPDIPEPEFESPDIDNSVAIAPTINVEVNIGGMGDFSSDGDYLPIVKVTPKYPSSALSRGTEGYCTVSYTVTITGTTEDIAIVDCPQSVFGRASVKAAGKFKYKPKVVDGNPIAVANVRNKFTFKLAEK